MTSIIITLTAVLFINGAPERVEIATWEGDGATLAQCDAIAKQLGPHTVCRASFARN